MRSFRKWAAEIRQKKLYLCGIKVQTQETRAVPLLACSTVSAGKWSHFLAGTVHRKQPGVCTSVFFNHRAAPSRSGIAGGGCWGSALGEFAASCPPRTAVSRTLALTEDFVLQRISVPPNLA